MGFNTTVFILNDQLDQIRRDPDQFVDRLYRAICGDDRVHVPGQTTVMPTAHADEFRLYATRCNSILELTPYAAETKRLLNGEPFQREHVLSMIGQAEDKLRRLRAAIEES